MKIVDKPDGRHGWWVIDNGLFLGTIERMTTAPYTFMAAAATNGPVDFTKAGSLVTYLGTGYRTRADAAAAIAAYKPKPTIKRVDPYNVTINGVTVRLDVDAERRLRAMDADAVARFLTIMGG